MFLSMQPFYLTGKDWLLRMKKNISGILLISGAVIVVVAICVAGAFLLKKPVEYETLASSAAPPVSSVQSDGEKTGEIQVTGDDAEGKLDIALFAKKAYELKYLFAVSAFDTPSQIPVSALVQYAFCHLYYESLLDMPAGGKPVYREADEQAIRAQLEEQFGRVDVEVKNSDLYNPENGVFEMWQPNNQGQVSCNAHSVKTADGLYEITVEFFDSQVKNLPKGTAKLTLSQTDSGFIIVKMAER